jgi:hypothetical protein
MPKVGAWKPHPARLVLSHAWCLWMICRSIGIRSGGPFSKDKNLRKEKTARATGFIVLFFALGLLGLGFRLFLIFGDVWMNDSDLRNYYWAAKQAAEGENPYELWSQDIAGPRSDLLPLELALLTLVVLVGKTPAAIRAFFLMVEVAVLAAILWRFAARPCQQLLWFALYAVSIGPLYLFVMTPSDKPMLLLWFIIILGALQWKDRWRSCSASLLTGLLGAFKWFGLFFSVPVAKASSRKRNLLLFGYLALIGGVFCLCHIPWFPDWMVVYQFRAMRFGDPSHSGLAVLLKHIGLPMAKLYYPLIILSWGVVTWSYFKGWLDTPSAMALSVIAILIWAPDTTPQMLFLLTLIVLLVVRWDTLGRAAIVWGGTSWMTLMTIEAVTAAIGGPAVPGLKLTMLAGPYGGIRRVIWSHLMLGIALFWLVRDQRSSLPAERSLVSSARESASGRME